MPEVKGQEKGDALFRARCICFISEPTLIHHRAFAWGFLGERGAINSKVELRKVAECNTQEEELVVRHVLTW